MTAAWQRTWPSPSTLAGRDAHFTVDGTAYVRAANTVSDVLVGATMTLQAATGAPVAVATDPAGRNPDAIVGQLQGLVSAYNAVLDGVASSSDSLLYGIRDQLQRATQDPVAGAALRQAAAIGLSTGASTGSIAAGSLSGKLVLDEAQLRTALGRDPGAVATLVDGLATRLDGVIASAGGALQGRTGAENARIAEYHASLDQMTVRLDDRERRLRAQFTAMEQSLAQLKSLQAQFPSTFA